jgi:hypothetical protein
MHKAIAIIDPFRVLYQRLFDNTVRRGLIAGMTLAGFFIWGP